MKQFRDKGFILDTAQGYITWGKLRRPELQAAGHTVSTDRNRVDNALLTFPIVYSPVPCPSVKMVLPQGLS